MATSWGGTDGTLAQLACLVLVVAFLLRDQKLLRILALVAGALAFAWFHARGDGAGRFWSGLFVAANGLQLALMAFHARRGIMTGEQRELVEQVLEVEEPAQQRRLLDVIAWRDVAAGEVLMRQGQKAPPLVYIASGTVDIVHDGQSVGVCDAGDFLGEMSLVSGGGATATATVVEAARIAVFDRAGLQRLANGLPELSRALDRAINKGLSAKIERMNKARAQS